MDTSMGTVHISAFNEHEIEAAGLSIRSGSKSDTVQSLVRYGGQSYTREELQQRLRQELSVLLQQLKNCQQGNVEISGVVAETYEDMIKRRQKEYDEIK